MATTLGPLTLLTEATASNGSTVVYSLVNGEILSGGTTVSEPGLVNTFGTPKGISIFQATRNPFLYFLTINLNSNVDYPSIVTKIKVFDGSGNPITVDSTKSSTGGGYLAAPYVFFFRGLKAVSGDVKRVNIFNANSSREQVRLQYPTLFPIVVNGNVDANTGIFNKTLFLTVVYVPPLEIAGSFTRTISPFNIIVEVYAKSIVEVTPPPSSPTPTTPKLPPVTPPPTTNTPTTTVPSIPELPDDPDSEYTPPEEEQLIIRCTDADSIALYGTLVGTEFESEFIETLKQATRVCEKIRWEANQVLITAFSVAYDPTIKRGQTIQVQSNLYIKDNFKIDFLMLVKSVSHVFDTQTGEATTQIIARTTEYIFVSTLGLRDSSERLDLRQELS